MRLTEMVSCEMENGDKTIEFQAAGLYIPAAQVVFATTASAIASILGCWLVPNHAISAVRTLALSSMVGLVAIRKPIRVGTARGVTTIFTALRPCVPIYLFSLIIEQLTHGCVVSTSYQNGIWRRVLFHVASIVMAVAGFVRAARPRGESDVPFLATLFALLAVALLPPPAIDLAGPLCAPATLVDAGTRVVRAFGFSVVYTSLVYASAPISGLFSHTAICVARSTSAAVWVLCIHIVLIPLSILQVAVILYHSIASAEEYDTVGVDVESADRLDDVAPARAESPALSVASRELDEVTMLATAAVKGRLPAPQAAKGAAPLTFSLIPVAATATTLTSSRIAEIAMREANS